MVFSVTFFLLLLPFLAAQSADGGFGLLQESRRGAKNKSKPLFVCYQGDFNSTETSRPPLNGKCVGKICVRFTHVQCQYAALVGLSCKNFTELDEEVGQCREVGNQMPGQTDQICLCEGNWCNGVGRLKVPLLLTVPVLLLLFFIV